MTSDYVIEKNVPLVQKNMEALLEELHGTARLQVHLARMDGHRIDKHTMRFNDIVNAAVQYGRMSSCFCENTARAAIYETVEYCVIGSPEHTGEPWDCMAYKWMEAAQGQEGGVRVWRVA